MKSVQASVLVAALIVLAIPASAVPLDNAFGGASSVDTTLPGTTVGARPELAGPIIADTFQPFSFTDSGQTISGSVQSRVVQETGTGTLDFYWRVIVDSTGSLDVGITAFRL